MWGGGVITNPVPGSTGSFFKKYLHGLISWVPMKNLPLGSVQVQTIQYSTILRHTITLLILYIIHTTIHSQLYIILCCTVHVQHSMYSTPPGVFSLGSCEEAKARTQHILFPTKITGFVASSVLPPLRIITRFSQHPPLSFWVPRLNRLLKSWDESF